MLNQAGGDPVATRSGRASAIGGKLTGLNSIRSGSKGLETCTPGRKKHPSSWASSLYDSGALPGRRKDGRSAVLRVLVFSY
jgi:hypothetical protein